MHLRRTHSVPHVLRITTLYDQSGKGNHLVQAPRADSVVRQWGINKFPIRTWHRSPSWVTKCTGIFIEPGMGLRWNDAKAPQSTTSRGQYWVINGHHYNNGCCYDTATWDWQSRRRWRYNGNHLLRNANYWYHDKIGPWVMTDQENNLVGCVNQSPNDSTVRTCQALPAFVTSMADGEPHHWRSMGGDAQHGIWKLCSTDPVSSMKKQLWPMRSREHTLGQRRDNSNGSQGTFYEGAMTAAAHSDEGNQPKNSK